MQGVAAAQKHLSMLLGLALRHLEAGIVLSAGMVPRPKLHRTDLGHEPVLAFRVALDGQPERAAAGRARDPDAADLALGEMSLGHRPERHLELPATPHREVRDDDAPRASDRPLHLPAEG